MDGFGQLISPTKAVLGEIHKAPGWRMPRPPLTPVGEADRKTLVDGLCALGVEGVA